MILCKSPARIKYVQRLWVVFNPEKTVYVITWNYISSIDFVVLIGSQFEIVVTIVCRTLHNY